MPADVVIRVEGVNPEEVAVEPLAQPVAVLGLDDPVSQFFVILRAALKIPRFVATPHLKGSAFRQPHFDTHVWCHGTSTIKKIGLNSKIPLGRGRRGRKNRKQYAGTVDRPLERP